MLKHTTMLVGLFALSSAVVACSSSETEAPITAYEGDEPNECSDGVDNDRNGYFDCDDKACWGSPACQASASISSGAGDRGTGGQGGAATSGPTGSGATGPADPPGSGGGISEGVAAHLSSVTLSYTVSYDLDQFGDSLCKPGDEQSQQVCDCQAVYEGTGTQVEAEGSRVTMWGSWKLASTDCGDAFLGGLWVGDDEQAHHSFHFDGSMSELQTWVVHADAQNHDPILVSPKSQQQFWIAGMIASWNDTTLVTSHTEQEQQYLDIIQVTVDHGVDFSFTAD